MPDDVKREDLTATRSKEYPAVITALDHLAPEEQQPPLPSPTIPLPSSPSSTSQSRAEGNGNKKRSPKPHPWVDRSINGIVTGKRESAGDAESMLMILRMLMMEAV